MTNDVAGAKAFYDEVVGWRIDADGTSMPNGSEYRMIVRSDGGMAGGLLTISEDMASHGTRPMWIGYIHHPDVDQAAEAIETAGGAVHMPPMDMEGVGRMAMVSDPQGALFYVMKPTPPADNPDATSDVFSVDQPQHVRWNELWASDQDAAIELYTRLFGWTQQGEMEMGPYGKYKFIQNDGVGIGAVGWARPEGDGSRWSFAIGVDDIDRAIAAAKKHGGSLSGEPQQVPGGEYSLHCTDPQGAGFALVGPRKGA